MVRSLRSASWEQTPWDEFWGPAEDRREVSLGTGMETWTGSGSDEVTEAWQGTNVSFSCSFNLRYDWDLMNSTGLVQRAWNWGGTAGTSSSPVTERLVFQSPMGPDGAHYVGDGCFSGAGTYHYAFPPLEGLGLVRAEDTLIALNVLAPAFTWTRENEHTTERLMEQARESLSRCGGWESQAWGTRVEHRPRVPYLSLGGTNVTQAVSDGRARRHLAADETALDVERLQYRPRLLHSVAGRVYRAVVVHAFTPEGGTNAVAVCVTNRYVVGNGGEVVFPGEPTVIEPPEENGSVRVEQLKVDIKRDGNVITDMTTNVMVGDKINLTGKVSPAGLTIASKQWTIPATTVKTYSQTVANAAKTDLAQTDLQQDNISYHWIDGGDAREVKYTVVVGGTTCEGKATFNIKRPMATLTSQTTAEQPPVGIRDLGAGQELVFGSFDSPGIAWRAEVTTPANGAGKIALVQLNNADGHMTLEDDRTATSVSGGYVLDPSPGDGSVYYGGAVDIGSSDSQTLDDSDVYSDTPGSGLTGEDNIDDQAQRAWGSGVKAHTRNDQFGVYLMYKSDSANSIWVTLRILQWHWSGGATKNVQTGVWSLDAGATSSQNPGSVDSATLPEWTGNNPIGLSLDE